jgi:hypothetical protein
VAGASDGRVISGGRDGRVRVWDPHRPGVGVDTACIATKIAAATGRSPDQPHFVLAHEGYGFST